MSGARVYEARYEEKTTVYNDLVATQSGTPIWAGGSFEPPEPPLRTGLSYILCNVVGQALRLVYK